MEPFNLKSLWSRIASLSRLKKILLGIFLTIAIFIASLSSLVSTEAGSRWIINKLASAVKLQLGDLHGNLLTGLDVASVDYHQNELGFHAEKVSLRWQPLELFYTTLSIQSLSAEKIKLHLPPAKNEPASENDKWPSLAQPVRIKLEKIQLHDIQIQQGETLVPITTINGNLGLGTFHLRAKDLVVENPQAHLKINGSMGLRYPYALAVDADWQLDDKSIYADKVSGHIKLGGDIKTLKLQQDLAQPLNMKLLVTMSPALRQPKVSPSATISLDWDEQNLPEAWSHYVDAYLARATPATPTEKTITQNKTQGHINIDGWLNSYKVKTQMQVSSATKNIVVAGSALGGFDVQKQSLHTHIEKLNLLVQSPLDKDADSNAVLLKGDINGLHEWQWNLNAQTEHFNLNHFLENWPSNLQATVDAQGSYNPARKTNSNSGLNVTINNINAQGDVRGLAVSARGEIEFDGEHWSSSDANLAIGANQVVLKGQTGNALNIEWKINAPLLGQIDPGISGSIMSNGVITGEKANPRIQIKAQVNKFVWHDYAIENLSLALNPKSASQDYDLLLDAAHMQWQSQTISHATIKGAGTLAQHIVTGQVESPETGNANFKLSSGWQDEIWLGKLEELAINIKKIPRWSLSSASTMEINTQSDKKTADLGKLCLTTVNAEQAANNQNQPMICVGGHWNSTSGSQIEGNLAAVPMNHLQAWFKSEAVLSGTLDGQLKLQIPTAKPMLMDAHLATRDVQLQYQFQGGKVEVYPLQKGSIDASIKNDQLNANLLLDWGHYGVINADTKYSLTNKKIQGKFSAALNDLAPLESLLPFLNDVQGSASANMTIAGTSEKPEIVGNIALNNGSANLPKLGLILRDISLQVNSQRSGQVHVDGQITSGEGTLMLRGDLENLGTPQWAWKSNIYGADIRFIEQPQMVATVSPNLKLSADANAINLTGSTEIPFARAALKTLPSSATRVSSDVVVIESDQLLADNTGIKKSIPFLTNIILYFGDDVRFKGFGLDTQLLGKVNILKEENRQTFVTGFAAVGKGNYKAYGQDLVIERGRLIFQGPYDNPGLDIRATRVLDNGVAGLEIGGTLQHPRSSVFSIPAAPDSQAMAMLLTGKALSESSQADAYSLIGAISSLGMDNGEGMTSDIAHFFHIDEITVKADKGLDQSALWMGKYVTPKLFIRYIVGLFDQTFSLGVRYQLNDKLRLEAESGKNQSVDVIYKIER